MYLYFFQIPAPSPAADGGEGGFSLWSIFETLFQHVKEGFPKFLGAIALLVAGWLVAKTVRNVLQRLLEAVKADKLTDQLQQIEIVQRSGLQLKASVFLSKTVYYALLLIFIIVVSDMLGLDIVSKQIADLLNYLPKFISAMVVFVVGLLASNFVKGAVSTAFRSLGIPSGNMISGFIFYFMLLTLSITALEQGGMNTDFLTENIQIILAGMVIAFAVGFGFSSRDVLKNLLASGYSKKKFKLGDVIRVGEYKGKIIGIDSTAVTLLLEDGGEQRRVIIPQHEMIQSKVELF